MTDRYTSAPVLRVVKALEFSSPTEDENELAYKWLASRGITRSTAIEAGVIGGTKFIDGKNQVAIGFPYSDGTSTYAFKWRTTVGKAFTQTGAAQTLWLSEKLKEAEPVVITEGEMDCLSLWQAGIPAVSVPSGAPSKVSGSQSGDDKRFAFLYAADITIKHASKIIIATDGDNPGQILAEEIARRIGRAKCWKAKWPEGCKDANDVLLSHGADVLRECIENAEPWPVKGLYDADHFASKVTALYEKGLPKGELTGFRCVDELYTIVPGQISIVTGAPGSGKSAFIDNVMVNLAKTKGWRLAVCSFENPPEVHIAKLASIAGRQPFFDGPTPRMDKDRRDRALQWVNNHFSFLHQADGSLSSLDEILDLTRSAILRYGIRGLVLDPYNYIARSDDQTETDWISSALTKLKVLAAAHDIHIWMVAHPTKLRRKDDGSFPIPTGYDISGGANWFNKADMGITLNRPDVLDSGAEFHCWKVRFSWTGKIGSAPLHYDVATGLFFEKVTE